MLICMISKAILLRLIPCMDEYTSVDKIADTLSLSKELCRDALNYLLENGIGRVVGYGIDGGEILSFNSDDRISSALLALRLNASMDEVTPLLDWRDFEALASDILDSNGYYVVRNLRLSIGKTNGEGKSKSKGRGEGKGRGRIEIDVVGIKSIHSSSIALAIDCKHWRYIAYSALVRIAEKQVQRTHLLLGYYIIDRALPVIITLRDTPMLVDGIPIVPISRFNSFLNEYDINDDVLRFVTRVRV
jgi:hypothetical protein